MLTPTKWACLEEMGFTRAIRILPVNGDTLYMIMLRECFDAYICTFLLLMGEMTMILEDIYHIFRVPLKGEQVTVAIDKVVLRPYIGEGYKTKEI